MQIDLDTIAIRIPVILFAISIHECAHAWMADRCGDPTARYAGRITLNPLAHLDPMGTICMVFFRFGWGKPVPVNPYNLHNPRRDDVLVSAAGPVSNFIMALVCGIAYRVCRMAFLGNAGYVPPRDGPVLPWFLCRLTIEGVFMACALGLFNLIPVFPLDGSHILKGLLPTELAIRYEGMNQFGWILLMLIIFTGGTSLILGPPLMFLVSLFAGIPF